MSKLGLAVSVCSVLAAGSFAATSMDMLYEMVEDKSYRVTPRPPYIVPSFNCVLGKGKLNLDRVYYFARRNS